MRLLSTVVASVTILGLAAIASARPASFDVILDGPSESPANASPGTGVGQVDIDEILHTMRVQVSFSGLTGVTTASHIHAATTTAFTGTAGVATQTPSFSTFPLGVTSGSMDQTFDMTLASSYNGSFITANGGTPASAEAALYSAMLSGKSYLNIHSQTFGGGEIRGFLVNAPEPATAGMLAIAAGAMALRRRRATAA